MNQGRVDHRSRSFGVNGISVVRMGMCLTENAHSLHSLTANSSYTGWFGIDVLAPRSTFHC